MRVVPGGLPCGCGAHGCIEQYGSGRALQRMANELADAGGIGQALADVRARTGALSGHDISDLIIAGDPGALAALRQLGDWLGQACASLGAVLDPQLFVFGGGVAQAGELLLEPIRQAYLENLPARGFHPEPEFAIAELVNDAGCRRRRRPRAPARLLALGAAGDRLQRDVLLADEVPGRGPAAASGIFRPWVVGLENIPAEGAVILASNHLSFIDSVFLPLDVDRRVSFLAKSDYFTRTGLKGWATKAFMNATGQLPIDRSGGKASEASLNTGLAVLARGKILGIYPEGTRSPDGKLYRGRTGVARMILEAGVPVVPVAMVDTDEDHADRHAAAEDRPHRHHHRRAARLLPVRGDGGRPLHPALRHRRDHVRAARARASRSTSTSTPPASRKSAATLSR